MRGGLSRGRGSSVAESAGERATNSGENLAGPLLLALLRSEGDDSTSEHWQGPLQVAQLLLG